MVIDYLKKSDYTNMKVNVLIFNMGCSTAIIAIKKGTRHSDVHPRRGEEKIILV